MFIDEVDVVEQTDEAVPVEVVLENTGNRQISGTAAVTDTVDDSYAMGEASRTFTVAGGERTEVRFSVAFGEDCYSALYPVWIEVQFEANGEARRARAVRIVETRFEKADVTSTEPTDMEVNVVPQQGALPLWTLDTHRVAWRYYDSEMQYKRAGWTGSDEACRASMYVRDMTRGDTRPAINMHPPWQPGGGTIFCDYLVKLPDIDRLRLTFANAIRDNSEDEPPSDGVWFRVWAARGEAGEDAELLYQNFTDTKVWEAGEADLSEYGGETVLLRLESHPGPDRDTTCDSSYWAEPTVIAGPEREEPEVRFEQAAAEGVRTGRRLLNGTLKPDGRFTFVTGEGDDRTAVVLQPTKRGIIDGTLSLVAASSAVSFDGFNVDILGQHAVKWPTAIEFIDYKTRVEDGKAVHIHRLQSGDQRCDVEMRVWPEDGGVRISWQCPLRVTDFSVGPTDQRADAVYYGHGYRIHDPKPFRAGFGGHNLSTSHVGFDFADGLSVLQAVDVPPNYLQVSPEGHSYALHTHMNGTLTLVASERGAFDCAIKYRPLYDKEPAGGVERLAGRMCFDIWGGAYADIADSMARMARYGLTDSFLTVHVWQRWGYDYRLPDIWPPNPRFGTIEDMRRIGRVCEEHDIPWGLHDNYIDFYPDATGFTYEKICFLENGRPREAWYNRGREAQSYKWRPDEFMPFLKRNLRLIKDGVSPTHYFIDVFTSSNTFDFYDYEGTFHPSTETRRHWGEAFAWIRDLLGNDAPTTSEAGHDQLIGYLDGADCQHLMLTDEYKRHTIRLLCDDWERVPWYDAVNHHRFILHGVGYSGRYQGGRTRRDHGINSDDYISAEMLEGHALMVDRGCWGWSAVRKYWLAQPVARDLALQKIENVEFVDDDIHRCIVTWDNGTKVYVNRGDENWNVQGHALPKYGYLVVGDGLMSTIEKRDGTFCESSVSGNTRYCNSRTYTPNRRIEIEPRIEDYEYLGGQEFAYDMVWEAQESAPWEGRVFVHFYQEEAGRPAIMFQDDHSPVPPTDEWQGTIRYRRRVSAPEDAEGEYDVVFGLYHPQHGRLPIRGRPAEVDSAVWVGTISVKRQDGEVTGITFRPPPAEEPLPPPRLNLEGRPVDFGWAVTDGAFRLQEVEGGLRLTPLPDGEPFDVTLRLDQLGLQGARVERITARDGAEAGQDVEYEQDGDRLQFHCDAKAFCYDIET